MINRHLLFYRHRFYRHLFLVATGVVASMGVPFPIHRIGALGTVSLMVLLSVELGGPIRAHQTRHRWPDTAYRRLGLLTLVFQLLWMCSPRDFAFMGFPVLLATTTFIFWSLKRLLICLAQETQIRMAVLGGAVAGYLLLGISGGLLFGALETLAPGSFINQADGGRELLLAGLGGDSAASRIWDLDFTRIHYFAFVSLTTVGYGDIIPALPPAQMASVALSISGPLYLAIVMGLLISRYTLQAEQQQVRERSATVPGPPQRSGADSDDR
jgi:hypothetical protein